MANTKQEGYPRYLLKKPEAERYKYFESYSVAHAILDSAFNVLLQTILLPAGKRLVFVIGPTGSGKTFLKEWISDELTYLWSKQQHTDRGRIPVVGINVPSKDRKNPSCGDIYLRILRALEEPLIDKKIIYGDITIYRDGNGKFAHSTGATAAKWRYSLEQALKHRRPFILSLDEAQHLFDIAGLTIEEIMDWIKSFADMSEVLIVLFGTYEMLSFLDLSDQLMRRSRIIHLRRYLNSGDDLKNFKSTINAFQKNMPFKQEPNLPKHWAYLHERSVGCIGNLYDWLSASFHQALHDRSAKTLTLKHLKACAPLTATRASKMNKSIEEDESAFLTQIGKEDSDEDVGASGKDSRDEESEKEKPNRGHNKSRARRKSNRVGQRKPGRDRTGGRN